MTVDLTAHRTRLIEQAKDILGWGDRIETDTCWTFEGGVTFQADIDGQLVMVSYLEDGDELSVLGE